MKKCIHLLLLLSLPLFIDAQWGGGEANPDLKPNAEMLNKWQDLKFGLFVHWGPVSLRGTEIGWSRGTKVPIEEYDNLYKEFNPVLFDAETWVSMIKAAGMKYMIITSKHHDGFCIWDSEFTDHDIMSSPFKRDILKELSDECKRQGVLFGTYHSIADWHHPHYATRYGGDPRPVEELFNHALGLISNLDWTGTIDTLLALRKADINFNVAKVDGMLYVSLRNRGVSKIINQGDLEGGIINRHSHRVHQLLKRDLVLNFQFFLFTHGHFHFFDDFFHVSWDFYRCPEEIVGCPEMDAG